MKPEGVLLRSGAGLIIHKSSTITNLFYKSAVNNSPEYIHEGQWAELVLPPFGENFAEELSHGTGSLRIGFASLIARCPLTGSVHSLF